MVIGTLLESIHPAYLGPHMCRPLPSIPMYEQSTLCTPEDDIQSTSSAALKRLFFIYIIGRSLDLKPYLQLKTALNLTCNLAARASSFHFLCTSHRAHMVVGNPLTFSPRSVSLNLSYYQPSSNRSQSHCLELVANPSQRTRQCRVLDAHLQWQL